MPRFVYSIIEATSKKANILNKYYEADNANIVYKHIVSENFEYIARSLNKNDAKSKYIDEALLLLFKEFMQNKKTKKEIMDSVTNNQLYTLYDYFYWEQCDDNQLYHQVEEYKEVEFEKLK